MADFMTNVNPLMDFARKTECSVKIPSNGLWYDDDNIGFNAIGEVDIRPMLPNDEMKIVNPESLISGDAIISLIKSCCPSIKRPEELYYPDVNALLLGIKKATYGDDLEQEYVCPKCWEKKTKIENEEFLRLVNEKKKLGEITDDTPTEVYEELHNQARDNVASKITEMEKSGEIMIVSQKQKLSIDDILHKMKFLDKEYIITTKEGLKIYLSPYKCIDKIKFSSRNIQEQKVLKMYNDKIKNSNSENVYEYNSSMQEMIKMYIDLGNQSMDVLSCAILKIVLPNETVVTNHEYITEFIKNTSSELANKIYEKVHEINSIGIQDTFDAKCECCGHEWKEKFYGFNQSDFFGISS